MKFDAVLYFRSRKFVISLLTLFIATIILGLGWIAAVHWVTVTTAVMGLYTAANVAQDRILKMEGPDND
jgi:hypothetical protein